jgi:F0F1-type ATP synthase membrane subunit b/b'
MPAEKPKEDRKDAIIKRLAQIEAALSDLHLTEGNLRRERTALWEEYRAIVAAAIEGSGEPKAEAGMAG